MGRDKGDHRPFMSNPPFTLSAMWNRPYESRNANETVNTNVMGLYGHILKYINKVQILNKSGNTRSKRLGLQS
jgi:hypothetical protein